MPRTTRRQKSPAYQWYPKDFMSDHIVMVMTIEQEGVYRRLMDVCWLENGLPPDPDVLWTLAKCRDRAHFDSVWPLIRNKFQLRRGKLQQRRLDHEREKQANWRSRAASGGRGKAKRAKRLKEARQKGTHTEFEWAQLLVACGGRCVRCGSTDDVGKDHIVPLYQGGSDSIDNIQPLCGACNRSKGPERIDFRGDAKHAASSAQAGETPALRSSSSISSALPEKRERRRLAYLGTNLTVTRNQHAWLLEELGKGAGQIDILALYPVWDEQRPADATNTLDYLKLMATAAITAAHRAGDLFRQESAVDWFEECKRVHGGVCGGDRMRHHVQMQIDMGKKAAS